MDKVWYTSKTILLSLALTIIGVADLLGAIDLKPVVVLFGVPPEKAPGVVLLGTIVFTLLRVVTTKAVTLSSNKK